MSIRWDALLTRQVARELDRELRGASLRAFRFDGAERDLFLLFDDRTLVWRLHPTRGAVLMRPPTVPAPADLAHRARVRRVYAPDDERLIRIELLPRRSGPPHDLVVELLGNQWNALVVDVSSGTVRHVLWSRDTGRGHRVGERYGVPAPQERVGFDGELDEAAWLALLQPVPPERRRRELVRRVAWTSPLNADYLLGTDTNRSDRDRLALGYERWRALVDGTALGAPVILEADGGPQPYPLSLPGIQAREATSILDAVERAARQTGTDDAPTEAPLLDPQLMRRLTDAKGRAERKLRLMEREQEQLGDEQAVRAIGDLILARYGEIEQGAESAVLTGFDGEEVIVTLDPAKPPHENASRHYREATRIERARERLPKLIDEVRAERDRLDGLLTRAQDGSAEPDEIRAALPRLETDTRGRPDETPLPYRVFRSSGDLEIRVGRGARHNDELTFKHSAPGDIWLHARHAAGAHVILRWHGPGNPPSRDLTEAATLAALHSRARTSGSVPVDWTFRKYVRKPRGAPKGAVVPDRVSTLFVRPDPALEKALARDGESG
ncbi:MAG: NFACT RNA binding domain-containing protein [Gemmatimonadota bacterium]